VTSPQRSLPPLPPVSLPLLVCPFFIRLPVLKMRSFSTLTLVAICVFSFSIAVLFHLNEQNSQLRLELQRLRATPGRPAHPGAHPQVALPTQAQLSSRTTQLSSQNSSQFQLPILVLTYNRLEYLSATLETIALRLSQWLATQSTPPSLTCNFSLWISQDGTDFDQITSYIDRLERDPDAWWGGRFRNTKRALPAKLSKGPGPAYYYIASHYKFALSSLFASLPDAQAVLIVEEDMLLAHDALSFFCAGARELVRSQSTATDPHRPPLYAVSGWNDNANPPTARPRPDELTRSDFFPGLGWVLSRPLWDELAPKWPVAFWDDWMREPAQRAGRHSIYPSVSRTHTVGRRGSSGGQFFDKYLAANYYATDEEAQPWHTLLPASRALNATATRHALTHSVATATSLTTTEQLKTGAMASCVEGATFTVRCKAPCSEATWRRLTLPFGLMTDMKAGVPRGSLDGVVTFGWPRCNKNVTVHLVKD